MERSVGVEQARGELGRLAASVAAGDEPVVLTRHGRAEAFLVGRDEYAEFKLKRSEVARGELEKRLEEMRRRTAHSGLGHPLSTKRSRRRAGSIDLGRSRHERD
jgi:prevent-host-death family protein